MDAPGAVVAVEEVVGADDGGEAVRAHGRGADEEETVVAEEDGPPLAF